MKPKQLFVSWVVYRMTRPAQVSGNVVCEQSEWDALELARPGYHTLLHTGLKTEQEAEKLARGTAGDNYGRGLGQKKPKVLVVGPLVRPVE